MCSALKNLLDRCCERFRQSHTSSTSSCIAYGAFLLGKGIAPKGSTANVKQAKMLGPLPLGSWLQSNLRAKLCTMRMEDCSWQGEACAATTTFAHYSPQHYAGRILHVRSYQAFAWISPVYVTAIKRGDGKYSQLGVVITL
eukprot:763505-Hanusia_phi.AAC.3